MVDEKALLEYFRIQAEGCKQLDSPLTAGLVERFSEDYIAGGPVHALLKDWSGSPVADAVALRLAGALHGAALTKRAPALAIAYAAANEGHLDMTTLWSHAQDFLAHEQEWVRDYLQFAPQTNEARRSILLLTGFLYLADQFDMDIHMLELGASAGLNMNWD